MNKKISKEKVFEILKYVCIGLAIIVVVGLLGSLFTRSDGDGVRVPTNSRPSIEETEPAPVIKTFTFYIWGSGAGSPEYQSKHGMTFSYEEGMTWAEFCASDYNTDGMFSVNDPDYPYIYGPFDCTVVSLDEPLDIGEYPDEPLNNVFGPDVISSPYYGSDT